MRISVKADSLEVVITNTGDQSTASKPILTYKVKDYELTADAKGLLAAIAELQGMAMKMAAAAMQDDEPVLNSRHNEFKPWQSRFEPEPELDERR